MSEQPGADAPPCPAPSMQIHLTMMAGSTSLRPAMVTHGYTSWVSLCVAGQAPEFATARIHLRDPREIAAWGRLCEELAALDTPAARPESAVLDGMVGGQA